EVEETEGEERQRQREKEQDGSERRVDEGEDERRQQRRAEAIDPEPRDHACHDEQAERADGPVEEEAHGAPDTAPDTAASRLACPPFRGRMDGHPPRPARNAVRRSPMPVPFFRRILVPHDFSAQASVALRAAAALAREHSGRLTVLHVIVPFYVPADTSFGLAADTFPSPTTFVPEQRKHLEALVAKT